MILTFRDLIAIYLGRKRLYRDCPDNMYIWNTFLDDLGLPEPKKESKVKIPVEDLVNMINEMYDIIGDHGMWIDLSDAIRDEEGNHISNSMYGDIVMDAEVSDYIR